MRTLPALLVVVALAGCPKDRPPEPAANPAAEADSAAAAKKPHSATAPDGGPIAPEALQPSGAVESETACVDRWLAERKLDAYGSPEGTLYAGGTPLFDERTGETRDRLAYVYERQPAAKQACQAAAP